MKTLIKWFIKKYVNKDALKDAIHNANAALKESVTVDGGKQKVIDVGNDAAEVVGAYLTAYADDGRITDDAELAKVNAACDKVVDKYLTDETVNALIDRIFG